MSARDERVVEMRFENADFERKAEESLGTISKLDKALQFDQGATGADKISNALKNMDLASVADGVLALTERFSGLGIIATSALMNIGYQLSNIALQVANTLFLQPINEGLGEYELKLKSIQTIQSNTTNTIEEISAV